MRPWDEVEFEYPAGVPTMISAEERRYLFWLTSSYWSGRGHVVEMGPWLGGSTVCLAAGMAASPHAGRWRLHVYDSFVWREFMGDQYPLGLSVGESFEPHFRANLREYASFLEVSRAVLPDEWVVGDSLAAAIRQGAGADDGPVAWGGSEPVEILFVDGAKSWSGFRNLLATFGPSLVPGQALLVLQDFKYWGAFWVAAISELLAPALVAEHDLRENTVAFRVVQPLEAATIEAVPEWSQVTGATCEGLIDRAARRLEGRGDTAGAAIVRLSGVRMWVHKGEPARAQELFLECEGRWPWTEGEANLDAARTWLGQETGAVLPASYRDRARSRIRRLLARLRARVPGTRAGL